MVQIKDSEHVVSMLCLGLTHPCMLLVAFVTDPCYLQLKGLAIIITHLVQAAGQRNAAIWISGLLQQQPRCADIRMQMSTRNQQAGVWDLT